MNILVSTLRDIDGRFLPLIDEVDSRLGKYCRGGFIAYTKDTDLGTIARLKDLGFNLIASGLFGEARVASLKRGYESGGEGFFACDFDKVLHWLRVEPEEFLELLKRDPSKDYVVYGRGKKTWRTYPRSWFYPETAINGLVSKVVGLGVDVLTSASRMNRKAAKLIIEKAKEKSWGSAVEWLLLIYKAGFSVGYKNMKGLTWEDPDRFREEIKKAGGLMEWKAKQYDSVDEWEKRFSSAMEQIGVIERLGG